MTEALVQLKTALTEKNINFTENEPMGSHTTFLVGGAASLFIEPSTEAEIAAVQAAARTHEVPLFCLGRGSNLLVSDEGLPFAVLHLGEAFSGVKQLSETTLEVRSGTKLSTLCTAAVKLGLSGLEFAYGIPGTVGGGIYMNAGAYGGELCSAIRSVTFLDDMGTVRTLEREALDFGYRHSYFSNKGCIILSALFQLTPGDKNAIQAAMDDYMSRRRDKQPLEYGSAGSTFKRPAGAFAGALIEQCGLKGFTVGGAQVSEKHAGFVINRKNATAADVMAVMAHVQATVKAETGYTLEPEILILP
ncbi:MAG: UDP-N-acetylmuramate dehydrogenase [Angelakisella sp.]